MHTRRALSLSLSILVLASVALDARAKRLRAESHWRDIDVTIDGAATEWRDPLVRFNDQPVSFATLNDGEFLYLVLIASEPQARLQIARQGLIVWFDNEGGDKKRFGIKYPVGGALPEEYRGHRGRGAGSADDPSSSGQTPQTLPEPPNRLEILGPGKDDARSLTADVVPGIFVKTGQAEGLLTYELKVPLQANDAHPYAIGAKPGTAIGLGLETPKFEMRQEGSRGGGGGMGGGGMGGRTGGMGGMGRRGGGEHRFEPPKPLNGWISLQLASR